MGASPSAISWYQLFCCCSTFTEKKISFSDPRGAQVFGLVNTFVSGHRANCRLRVVINYRMAKSRENDTLAGGNVHRRSGPKKTRGGGRRKSHRLARNKQKKSPKTKFPRSRPIIKSLFKDNEKKKKKEKNGDCIFGRERSRCKEKKQVDTRTRVYNDPLSTGLKTKEKKKDPRRYKKKWGGAC